MPLTETERAYVAGIIDGEGSISLVQSFAKRTRGCYIYPLVRVANTDELLIAWLSTRIGNGASRVSIHKQGPLRKPVYHIGWASNEAYDLLEQIVDYLVIKRERAKLVIDLRKLNRIAEREMGGKLGHGRPIPEWLSADRMDLFEQMQELNRRGVGYSIDA